MGETIRDQICIGEFSGARPVIPFAGGLSVEDFREDDPEPFFVELPIAEAGVTSGNNRHYDEAFIRELERQVVEKRPVANMGHIPDAERSTSHPLPAGYWVGAARDGNRLWGKAYIPPGAVREYMRMAKKVGRKVGTSIYGVAEQVFDKALGAYRVKGIELESIDFGAAERIGVKTLAAVPVVAREMVEEIDMSDEKQVVDRATVIREMTREDAAILPAAVREAVIESAPSVGVLATVAEMVGGEDVVASVRAIIDERDALRRDVVAAEMDAQINERVKAEQMRGIVRELVAARVPANREAVTAALDAVLETESIREMLRVAVESAAGPAQKRPGKASDDDPLSIMLTGESAARLRK